MSVYVDKITGLLLEGRGGSGGGNSAQIVPVPTDADGNLLHLILEYSAAADFAAVVGVDTRTDRTGVYAFASDVYAPFPAAGVAPDPTGAPGARVLVERPAAAGNMQFVRCRWFDGADYTPWRAL